MIRKLYEKSELWFALTWIVAYCVLASVGDNLSSDIGILKIVTLPILLLLSITLYAFVKKNRLSDRYGLCRSRLSPSRMLFYIPLILLLTANFWYGIALNASLPETLLYISSMLLVGFLEEMIFRGFLLNAMLKGGARSAIAVLGSEYTSKTYLLSSSPTSFISLAMPIPVGPLITPMRIGPASVGGVVSPQATREKRRVRVRRRERSLTTVRFIV